MEPVFAALLKIRYLPSLSSFHRSFPPLSLSFVLSLALLPFVSSSSLFNPLRSRSAWNAPSRSFRGIFRRVRSIVGRSRQSSTGRKVSRASRPRDAHSSLFPFSPSSFLLDGLFSDPQKNATRLSLYIVPGLGPAANLSTYLPLLEVTRRPLGWIAW